MLRYRWANSYSLRQIELMAHVVSIYNPYDRSITVMKNRFIEEPKKYEYIYVQKEHELDEIMKKMYRRELDSYCILIDGFLLHKTQRKQLKELANKKAS